MSSLRLLLFVLFLTPLSVMSAPGDYVVLIPGTFAQWIPDSYHTYFSPEIVQVIKDQKYRPVVISGLAPTGDLGKNGYRVYEQLKELRDKGIFQKGYRIHLLGHSAGGFYALKALELNGLEVESKRLPISSVILLATPLKGTPIVDQILDQGAIGKILRQQLEFIDAIFFDTKGLYELASSQISNFLKSLRLTQPTRIFSISTRQGIAPIWDALNSQYLSPVYAMTSQFYQGESDGLIPDIKLEKNFSISGLPVSSFPNFSVQLDHAELVLDYRALGLTGAQNLDVIRERQKKLYQDVLKILR